MTISNNSINNIEKFLKRCVVHNNYIISLYVKDREAAELLMLYILDFYYKEYPDGDSKLESTSSESVIQIFFENESVIRIFTTDNMVSGIHANLIFMDSRIREIYIRNEIKPCIDKYSLDDSGENFIINPKLIYINFESEGQRNESGK